MKSDLDAIMQECGLDAIWVTGPGQHNPAMVYLTGGGHLTTADLIKKRGEPAVLFHAAMERDEAANTGLVTRSYSNYPYKEIFEEAQGDRVQATAIRFQRMFNDLGLTEGQVSLYGRVELSTMYPVLSALEKRLPGITFAGDPEARVLGKAMLTKDGDEVERIRRVGKAVTGIAGRVADYLTGMAVGKDEVLLNPDGQVVTIGQVKSLINLWVAEAGLENPEGTIFAIGRDGGVPHSSGNPEDPIRLGQPIVFDFFPCEAGGGYFYDFTRTWCLGYAPDEVQGIYDQVLTVFQTLNREVKSGVHFGEYQRLTCEMFEEMGHPTVATNPETEVGYVHSLGHGVGLRIHERPFSGASALPEDCLVPGSVFTLEPGLYYPDRGLGVRLENTACIREDGTLETLVDYPMDLVLPMKQ